MSLFVTWLDFSVHLWETWIGLVLTAKWTAVLALAWAAWPASAHGLAMARTSDVHRRLDALSRKVFRSPLSRRRVMPAVLVGSLILVLIGGFGFTRAEQAVTGERIKPAKVEPTSKPAGEKAAGKLTLRAVSAETNEPIAGVSIEYWVRSGEKVQEATISTGEDGIATIEWASGATVNTLGLTARAPGLVPIDILWDDERHPLAVPAEKGLRFEPGTTIGGIVRDQEDHPIEGATVIVYAPPTETDRPNSVFSLGKVQTNPEGRWRLDVAPKDLAAVWANVSHPHYQSDGMRVLRDLDRVLVLKKGLTVIGRVVDAGGRPVRGARAVIERDARSSPQPPTTTTDERGTFTLENCMPGQSIITVEAEGFSPLIQDIRVGERTAPVEFRLVEPVSLLRARVVDIHDKPIAAVRVTVKMWHGHRSIQFRSETDRDGRFEWRNAPKDAVVYNVGRADYMWASPTLTASEHEHTVILYPELVISGRVTDAETRSPVPKFRIVKGEWLKKRDEIRWAENNSAEVVNGPYRVRIGDAGDGALIRVEAPGYKAAV